eukprot:jgi/Psemu1/41682/gm1.41682_g
MPNPITVTNIQNHQNQDQHLRASHQADPEKFPVIVINRQQLVARVVDNADNQEWKIVIPATLIQQVIRWYHIVHGQCGIQRLYDTITSRFYSPNLQQLCKQHACPVNCHESKEGGRGYGLLPPRDEAVAPWNEVCVDLIGPWRIQAGERQYEFKALTTIDPVTNLVKIVRIKNKLSQHFQTLLMQNGIKSVATTVKNPQSNTICERLHQTMGDILRNNKQEAEQIMDNALASCMHATICVVNHTLQTSPGALTFGDQTMVKAYDPRKLQECFHGPYPIIPVFTNGTIKVQKSEAPNKSSQCEDYDKARRAYYRTLPTRGLQQGLVTRLQLRRTVGPVALTSTILPTRGFQQGPTRLQRSSGKCFSYSYRKFFQGAGPFGPASARHEVYQAIYTIFTESEGGWLLPLLLDLFNAQAIGGLGIFQEDAAGIGRLQVIHGLWRYPGTITQPSANLGNSFGYIDDAEGQECELVQVDAAMLSKAASGRVYLLMTHHEATLAQNPDQDYILAIPEGAAHTEMLQAHKVCFLPFEFIPLMLCRGLTPRQAFQVLHPHILQQGLIEICKPLLDTLRAVGTHPTTINGAIRLLEPGPSFRAEASLHVYMKRNSSQLHTVREVWGPLYMERLLLLCDKTDETQLPPIYTAWAKKSKHEKTHMILQSQVATDAYNLGIQAPLITTAVLKRLQDCNFYGTDPFDVADGIPPLTFTPPGGSAATLKREHEEGAKNVAAYNTMMSTQGNSLSLKDSLELQKTKAYIPLDWTKATTQLKSYMAVLATLLGATHDVVKSYHRGLSRLKWQQMPLQRAIADEVGERITPSDTTLPSPEFGEGIHWFQMTQNLNWLPNVSNVDALRPSSSLPTPWGWPNADSDQLLNPKRDPRITDLSNPLARRIRNERMRAVRASMKAKGKGPVTCPDGKEQCHTWHIKGSCFKGYRQLYNHSDITLEEQDLLWEWCQEAYA